MIALPLSEKRVCEFNEVKKTIVINIKNHKKMNIKNIIVLAVFIATSLTTLAQNTEGVSIAPNVNPPDPSAMLDVQSSDKGLLIPRVELTSTTDQTTIASPATSLLVYNTNTVSDVSPNFYYWNGTAWVLLGSTNKVPKVTYSQMQSMIANLTLDDLGLSVFVTDRGYISNVLQDNDIITHCTAEVYGLWYLSSIECTNGDILFWRRISTNQGTIDPSTSCATQSGNPTLCDPVVE
ncbi:MAG: hypothetical protein CMD31_12950 [Flavobacteriales bacterium]|jgi:hypothetical protein|nr:hypothetical protein [Flavobacteriales bacterium]|tara:strand:+ start:12928 stop:13635 length:708 start_codon:yes stop_codon:yes gene_type:complete